VLQVINEPAAAVLAYDTWNYTEERCILVYRLGGSTCDVSVVNVSGGLYTILKHARESGIGGQNITNRLSDYIAKEFYQRCKLDPNENRRSRDKLFQHANACKHVLSSLTSAHVFIESLCNGVDWSQNVSRARFENLLTPDLETYLAPVRKILEGTDFNEKINTIIFSGGSMKIPKLQSAVSGLFPEAEVLSSISPDEVIAQGCAKQAAIVLEHPGLMFDDSVTMFDCIPKSIYAKYNDLEIPLFNEGSPNYAEVRVPFKRYDKSAKICVQIFQEGDGTPIGDYTFNSTAACPYIHAVLHDSMLQIDVV